MDACKNTLILAYFTPVVKSSLGWCDDMTLMTLMKHVVKKYGLVIRTIVYDVDGSNEGNNTAASSQMVLCAGVNEYQSRHIINFGTLFESCEVSLKLSVGGINTTNSTITNNRIYTIIRVPSEKCLTDLTFGELIGIVKYYRPQINLNL
jgi:hypothetical protein